MPIQVYPPKQDRGKLVAAGIIGVVLLVAFAMPRVVRGLFVVLVALAATAAFWLGQ